LVARGHGEQCRDRAKLEGARRGRMHACEAVARSCGAADRAGRSARFDRAWRPQSQSGVDGITDKPCVARRRGVVNVGKAQILNPDHVRGSGICKRKLNSRPLRSKPPRTAWRATGWWPDHYSIAIFDITKVRGGSKLTFTQIGIPPSRYSGHYRGWIE